VTEDLSMEARPVLLLLIGLGSLACGGGGAAVVASAAATGAPAEPAADTTAKENKPETADAAKDKATEPDPPPAAEGASPPTEPPSKPKKPPSGRPNILMGPQDVIESTFGSTPGAVLKLKAVGGNITLKIPEFSLPGGTNIVWKIAKGATVRSKLPVVGSLVLLKSTPAGKLEGRKIESDGDPFELRLPTGGKESVNLALGEVTANPDTSAETVSWTVIGPKRVDAGLKEATFELGYLAHAYMHATTAAPGAPKEGEGGKK
jgi:hypothetical protein